MPIGISRARSNLARRSICDGDLALEVAEFADDILEEALNGYVTGSSFDLHLEQLRADRAEFRSEMISMFADFRTELRAVVDEFAQERLERERQRDERERQRDERERERDERERQRDLRNSEFLDELRERDIRNRRFTVALIGIGIAVASLVTGLIVALT